MTILFSGVLPIPGGMLESAVVAVPGNIKQPGVPLNLLLSVDDANVPDGTTTLTVFL